MTVPPTRFNKTRIAPTPSGYLHLGNIMSFAITAAIAQKTNAKIFLRIDDIDQARADKKYIQDIFDTLNFLEIPWHEGPRNLAEFEDSYSQVHRVKKYQEAIEQLLHKKLLYACNCSRAKLQNADDSLCDCINQQIPLSMANVNWRFITGSTTALTVKDLSGKTIKAILPAEMQNFIVRKKDGFPSYQLTSIIDDLLYEIDLIVRGNDLWPSTLAQHQLAMAMGLNDFAEITFYHHPLIVEASGKKLSKSAGAASVKYLKENGKTAAEIYTLTGKLLGIDQDVTNWQQLAEAINSNQVS
jgi:glutamyl/glutaminyl-tRNA synthetase